MSTRNWTNEKLLIEYEEFLREAKGKAKRTIGYVWSSLRSMLDDLDNLSLRKLNKKKLLDYKKSMRTKAASDEKKMTSVLKEIGRVRSFLLWMINKPGYKKLTVNDIQYLTLTQEERAQLKGSPIKSYPSRGEIEALNSMAPRTNDVEWRNYIVFLLLISIPLRVKALMTLPLKAFDMKKGILIQDPRLGIETKHSTSFVSYIFEVIPGARAEISKWIDHLYSIKGITPESPIIPRAKMKKMKGDIAWCESTEVSDLQIESATTISRILEELAESAGIKCWGPHAFRHSLANHLFEKATTGADIKMLSQCFGHKTIVELLKTYGTLTENQILEVGKGFDERMLDKPFKGGFVS